MKSEKMFVALSAMKQMLRRTYYFLPARLRFFFRRVIFLPVDIYESASGQRKKAIPPKGLQFIGSGNFEYQGKLFLDYFRRLGNLGKDDHVLDVGCGIGRMALPLTGYLSNNAKYTGFDIVKKGIKWCQKNISEDHPNFHFIHADIENDLYNPGGTIAPNEYEFPVAEKSQDFIFLTSVFTHMLPDATEHYLSEISKVLKKKGRCFMTLFLLNEVNEKFMKREGHKFHFSHCYDNYALFDKHVKTANIAFKEEYFINLLKRHDLKLVGDIHYGSWSGRPDYTDFQDIIVIEKN